MEENLKKLRKLNGLTQDELSKKVGIPQTTYNSYETGRSLPTIEPLIKIADFYNISLDYLAGREFHYEFEYLTEQQKAVVKLICQLNENNLLRVASYISGMLAIQD